MNLGLLIETQAKSIKFFYQEGLTCPQNKRVTTSDFFQNQTFHVAKGMSWQVDMFFTGFWNFIRLHIVLMFIKSFLKRSCWKSYVFTMGENWAVILCTFPIVHNVDWLAIDRCLNVVFIFGHRPFTVLQDGRVKGHAKQGLEHFFHPGAE